MKIRYILLALLVVSAAAFSMGPLYDDSKPPTLALPAAYQLAATALGSATNQFHCVSASITLNFGAPRWAFIFCSTNTPPIARWMTVDFGGKTKEEEGYGNK